MTAVEDGRQARHASITAGDRPPTLWTGATWPIMAAMPLCSLRIALTLFLGSTLPAQETKPASRPSEIASDFLRFVELGRDEGRLETAVTTYEGPKGESVTLVAALHVADESHYKELQERFATYDALLYELVGPQGYRPTKNQKGGGVLTFLQRALKQGLDLAFQLDALDYSPENFVHADLDPTTFAKLQKERGESILTLLFHAMAAQTKKLKEAADRQDDAADRGEEKKEAPTEPDLIEAFRSGFGRHVLRLTLARQFEDLEAIAAGFSPGKKGSVLVEGRNDRALEVLVEQIAKGKKNFGIYYGAAHMPHFEQRLTQDMGFKKVDQRWVSAWDVRKRPDKAPKRRLPRRLRRGRRSEGTAGSRPS